MNQQDWHVAYMGSMACCVTMWGMGDKLTHRIFLNVYHLKQLPVT